MDVIQIISYQRIVGNHGTEVAERAGETVGMCSLYLMNLSQDNLSCRKSSSWLSKLNPFSSRKED